MHLYHTQYIRGTLIEPGWLVRSITYLLVYGMCVHSVKPVKGNCIWMTGVSKGLFTETVHYVVLGALSQDLLSVLGSPRLSSKHRLFDAGQKDSSPQPLLVTKVTLIPFP